METLKYNEELTREEVVAMVGEAKVLESEADNCDYTNTIGQNGENGYIGFTGYSEKFVDPTEEDYEIRVEVFYAVPKEEHEIINENGGDLGGIDWENCIDHYKIID